MFCQTNYGLFESTERFDRTLTALGNHIRAVCYEFGLTINLGKAPINKAIVEFASAECNDLPEQIKLILNILSLQYRELDSQHQTLTKQLKQLVTQSEPCKRLMELEGVSHIGAAGLLSCLGDGKSFRNGRHAAVYVGATQKNIAVVAKLLC